MVPTVVEPPPLLTKVVFVLVLGILQFADSGLEDLVQILLAVKRTVHILVGLPTQFLQVVV